MEKNAKIYVAGHNGMVGSAIVRKLNSIGFENIIVRSKAELDLRIQKEVSDFFSQEKPDYVFLAAAKVGGIHANDKFKAEFIYDNLMIELNVINCAYSNHVKKLLFLGSSCLYPKMAQQPISEEALLTGFLEPTNEPYAIAKIAGIKMCDSYREQYGCDFISLMPTNLYGPNDNYNLQNSHVIPAMIRKFHEAKIEGKSSVEMWGSGSPQREFLHVDDLADACLFLMDNYSEKGHINVGSGEEVSIKELAYLIKGIVDFSGEIVWNTDYPDGTPRKLLNSTKLSSKGWNASISLEDGLKEVYRKSFLN